MTSTTSGARRRAGSVAPFAAAALRRRSRSARSCSRRRRRRSRSGPIRRRRSACRFPIAETGFDPQATSDYYSSHVERAIFEPLYTFDYLARPHRIVPNTAAAMPEISADGRTWKIRIRPGIHFADDPAFKGRKRELIADDYVYSFKRLLDPRMRAPMLWFLDGKIAGSDDVLAKAKQAGRLDYDAPMEGLKALDRYTLQITLKEPDYVLQGYLTQIDDGGGRARGDRGLRRRLGLGDGESRRHRALPAEGVAARTEDRAGGESELPRGVLSRRPASPATASSSRR